MPIVNVHVIMATLCHHGFEPCSTTLSIGLGHGNFHMSCVCSPISPPPKCKLWLTSWCVTTWRSPWISDMYCINQREATLAMLPCSIYYKDELRPSLPCIMVLKCTALLNGEVEGDAGFYMIIVGGVGVRLWRLILQSLGCTVANGYIYSITPHIVYMFLRYMGLC